MPKKSKGQETATLDSNDHYVQDANNTLQAVAVLRALVGDDVDEVEFNDLLRELPKIVEFNKIRKKFDMPWGQVLSVVHKSHVVRTVGDGYGEVTLTIADGAVTKIGARWWEITADREMKSR